MLKVTLIIILLYLVTTLCVSQKITHVREIVMSPCNIGTSKYSFTCDTVFAIKNSGIKGIELISMTMNVNYPWEINQKGNVLSLWGSPILYSTAPVVIAPNNSVYFTLRYNSYFVDSISKNGFLSASIRLTYALENDTTFFIDSITVRAKSVNTFDTLIASGTSTIETRACNTYNTSDTVSQPFLEYIRVYNRGSQSVTIDSLQYTTTSNMYEYLGIADEEDSAPYFYGKLPYILYADKMCILKFRNRLNAPNVSVCNVQVYTTNTVSKKQIILQDSISSLRKYLSAGYTTADISAGVGYIGDTPTQVATLFTSSCSGEKFTLDSITTPSWKNNEVVVYPSSGFQLPIPIDPPFIYSLSVLYQPISSGRIKGFIVLHFSNKDTSFKQVVRFTTFGQSRQTSVYDDYIKSNVSVFPNPANDFVVLKDVQGNQISSVKIYDVVGRLLLEQPINADTGIIHVEKLPIGTHMAIIHRNDNTIVQIPCVIMR